MLETLAKLVNADKIRVDFTEYELSSEFAEAMEHALEPGKGTKVLLRVNDVGSTYT
jgi:trans-2-enoyl-CoA reductase|tara:strand:- start:1837 stop:2004 length:168 start_codon:yes stop_codon:yes gene_type:complete